MHRTRVLITAIALSTSVAVIPVAQAQEGCTPVEDDASVCRSLIPASLALPPPTFYVDADGVRHACPVADGYLVEERGVGVVVPYDAEVRVNLCHGYTSQLGSMWLTSPSPPTHIGTVTYGDQTTLEDITIKYPLGIFLAGQELTFTLTTLVGTVPYSWSSGANNVAVRSFGNTLILGWEDQPFPMSDGDFNDEFLVIEFISLGCIDSDGDGSCDEVDNCIRASNADQSDTDADLIGDTCDLCPIDASNDVDLDGVCGDRDNCPTVSNPSQANADGQGAGDACLEGMDNDGDYWQNELDNCPTVENANQLDADGDGSGDACDTCAIDPFNDADNDGRCANVDNCPDSANADQLDADDDGLGDACDIDMDNDGHLNSSDNCPLVPNADQYDSDSDGQGDACDEDQDADSVMDSVDGCPMTPAGDLTDADGCSIAQLCPCDGDWRTHGQFVSCTAKVVDRFLAEGIITQIAKEATMSAAAKLTCGRK